MVVGQGVPKITSWSLDLNVPKGLSQKQLDILNLELTAPKNVSSFSPVKSSSGGKSSLEIESF